MKMFHKIVFATDLSERSLIAGEWAKYLSKISGSRLEIISVTESVSPFYKMLLGWTTILDENSNNYKHKMFSELEKIKKKFLDDGVNGVDVYLREGTPHWEIVDFLDYTRSSLVVLSNSSKGEEIGSTAYEVACLSPSNVLIVKGDKEPRIKNILVGIDFSKYSRNAFIIALAIAKTFSAKIYNAHVLDMKVKNFIPQNLFDELILELNLELTKVVEGIEIEPVIIEGGGDGKSLSNWAKMNNIDLIVIAYKGINDRTQFLGHFADEVIRSSNVPILLIRKFY